MNFRAIAVLKNSRDCVLSPSSMIFFFSLKRDVRERAGADLERGVVPLGGLGRGRSCASFSILRASTASRSRLPLARRLLGGHVVFTRRARAACRPLAGGLLRRRLACLAVLPLPFAFLRRRRRRRASAGRRRRSARSARRRRLAALRRGLLVGELHEVRERLVERLLDLRPARHAEDLADRRGDLRDVPLEEAAPLLLARRRARAPAGARASLRPHSWSASFISLRSSS